MLLVWDGASREKGGHPAFLNWMRKERQKEAMKKRSERETDPERSY